jgi:hypothetical protein
MLTKCGGKDEENIDNHTSIYFIING